MGLICLTEHQSRVTKGITKSQEMRMETRVLVISVVLVCLFFPSVSHGAQQAKEQGFFCSAFGFLVRPLGFCAVADEPSEENNEAFNETLNAQENIEQPPSAANSVQYKSTGGSEEKNNADGEISTQGAKSASVLQTSQENSQEEFRQKTQPQVPSAVQAPVIQTISYPTQTLTKEMVQAMIDQSIALAKNTLFTVSTAGKTKQTNLDADTILSISRKNNENTREDIGENIQSVQVRVAALEDSGVLNNTTLGGSVTLSNLTVGALLYTNGSGILSASDQFSISGNNMGLGTTSPIEKLTIESGALYLGSYTPGDTTNRLYNISGDLYWNGLVVGAASTSVWTTGGGNVYRATGNVGIGTSSPSAKLSVSGDAYITGALHDSTFATGTSGSILTSTATGTNWLAAPGNSYYFGTDRNGTQGFTELPYDYLATGGFPRVLFNKQVRFDSSNHSINSPALVFREEDYDEVATNKGSLMEWQQYFDAGTYPYGIAANNYGSNFTINSSGNKRVAWLMTHYDSTLGTGEEVHQHFNIETVKADFSTIITRLQISYGEDIALVGFPNSNVRVYDNRPLQFGSDADASMLFDTANNQLKITGSSANSGKILFSSTDAGTKGKFQFGSIAVLEENTGRLGIGTLSPGARIHASSSADEALLKLTNTDGGLTSAALMQFEVDNISDKVFQSGLSSDTTKRFNITAGGIVEWGAGGAFTRDTNLYRGATDTLKTDDSLTVTGTMNALDLYRIEDEKLADFATTNLQLGTGNPAHALQLLAGASTRLTITPAGLVGIGTTSPSSKLNVTSESTTTPVLTLASIAGQSADIFRIKSTPQQTQGDLLTFDASGNLGLGTSTVYRKVSVVAASNAGARYIDTTNNVNVDVRAEDFQGFIGTISNHDLRFVTNGSSQMSITNAGSVGIGTTSPFAKLSVVGTVAMNGLTTAGASGNALCLSSNFELIVNTGAQTCTVSSARFKNSISAFTTDESLAIIELLKPVTFTYNNTKEKRIGLIAEDVATVDERLIFKEADGRPRGVRYEDMVAVLIGAFKHQQEQLALVFGDSIQKAGEVLEATFDSIFAKTITVENLTATTIQSESIEATKKLCVDGVCVTGAELRTLLERANVTQSSVPTPPQQKEAEVPEDNGENVVEMVPPLQEDKPEVNSPQTASSTPKQAESVSGVVSIEAVAKEEPGGTLEESTEAAVKIIEVTQERDNIDNTQ